LGIDEVVVQTKKLIAKIDITLIQNSVQREIKVKNVA
jgi:hypothetical protein